MTHEVDKVDDAASRVSDMINVFALADEVPITTPHSREISYPTSCRRIWRIARSVIRASSANNMIERCSSTQWLR